jgi:uncharacterized cupin superfamily protein
MSDARSLLVRLRAADASLHRERLRPDAARRIRRRMDRAIARPSVNRWGWIPMTTFLAGAALVLAVLTLGGQSEPIAREPLSTRSTAVLPRPQGSNCRWNDHGPLLMEGACEVALDDPPVLVHTLAATRLSIDGHRAELEQGGALFEVAPLDGIPFEVVVPTGTITVVGTRFRVVVDEREGHVELFEGVIDFTPHTGDRVRLEAGQRLDFAVRSEATPDQLESVDAIEPPVEPVNHRVDRRAPRSSGENEPATDESQATRHPEASRRSVTALIDEVTALRARGDYRTAATLLETALAEPGWDRRAAEVLSFELGTILTRHLGDVSRACRHWAAHLERWKNTRYHEAIERHRTRLGCPP